MKVIFITRENSQMPAVRIRCYGFARHLKKSGVEAEVFSYADILGAKSGRKEADMTISNKIMYNLKAFGYLLDKNAILFLQRCNYHSLAPVLVKFLKRKKLVFDLDDWEARENINYYFGKIPDSKAEIAMRFIARRSDLCIGASRFLSDFLSAYNDKVIYIPTAVDTDIFRPGNREKTNDNLVLSWIGTLYRRDNLENLEFLIECFQELNKYINNIELEIVGDGIYNDQVQKLVDKTNNECIRFKNWIPPHEMPEYLKNIDIGIMPLIQNTKFNRAKSPTRLFEYMAMEKPVVVSGIGEAAAIIKDEENGFLASTKNEFVDKLKYLIKNRKLMNELGKNARLSVLKHYNLEMMSNNLLKALRLL